MTRLVLLVILPFLIAAGPAPSSPVAVNGRLGTNGNQVINEQGVPVQLRGVCTHGLQWFGDFYANGKAIHAAATEWGADVVRISVYIYEGGYLDNPEISPEDFDKMIDGIVQTCIETGIYCIIDWHIHHPGDPAFYLEDAKDFFEKMSEKYKDVPNVIYEIANEPNSTGLPGKAEPKDINWQDIKAYAEEVIPVIRGNAPEALVLVGTPSWCSFGASQGKDWRDVTNNPLAFENIAYVVHFYASGHGFFGMIDEVANHLPLFVTEWAAATWETTSTNNLVKAQPWIELLQRRGISWTYWNYSNGQSIFQTFDETTTAEGPFAPDSLNVTPTGELVYLMLNTPRDAWAAKD